MTRDHPAPAVSGNAGAPPALSEPAGVPVRVLRDVPYGTALVGHGDPGGPRQRTLYMDVYLPTDARLQGPGQAPVGHPGLLMAFGGAFHRGSRQEDRFSEGAAAQNTSVATYCSHFARQGYVCFSIDYRLIPEDPVPGTTPVVSSPTRIPRSRVDHVRSLMGLPPASDEMLWRGIEAASDDMASAMRYVRAHAARWSLDASRLAVGGFSAGARTALNAAFGEGERAAAVVCLSGYADPADLQAHLAQRLAQRPPVLIVHGEHDLDYVRQGAAPMAEQLRAAGVLVEHWVVPRAGHFYPAGAPCHAQHEATLRVATVEDAMAGFLRRTTGAAQT